MEALNSEVLCEITAELEAAQQIGATPRGTRRIVYVRSGTFTGPKLRGDVLPGGGDWLLLRPDGVLELDVRATLRTDDNHLIYTYYRGVLHAPPAIQERFQRGEREVDPSSYYFRTTPVFETGSEKYSWLNRVIAVGIGRRTATGVAYTVHEIL